MTLNQKGSVYLLLTVILGTIVFTVLSNFENLKSTFFTDPFREDKTFASLTTKEVKLLSLSYFPTKTCSALEQKLNLTQAQASSNKTSNSSNEPPFAIDGSLSTKWSPTTPFIGTYIQIDLGSSQNFRGFAAQFWSSDRPESYHIDTSQTGQFAGEETRVVTETQGLTGFYRLENSSIERKDYIFSETNARFIRLTIDKYRNNSTSEGQVNLYEFEVYASFSDKNCLDSSVTGNVDVQSNPTMPDPLSAVRERVKSHNLAIMNTIREGSKFKGYNNPNALSAISHVIHEEKEFLQPIPISTTYFGRPDYRKILNEENICNAVDNLGVKEVWVWSYHTDKVAPEESDMAMGNISRAYWNAGKFDVNPQATHGDISNSSQVADLPVCNKTYVLYNFVYGPSYGNAIHSYMHQIENELGYANKEMFWDMYVGKQYTFSGPRRCGHSHTPPNSIKDYGYDDQAFNSSDCEDWKPINCTLQPENAACGGTRQSFNCSKWNCDPVKYYTWWMQNLPGMGNTLTYNGEGIRNWWEFMADFDQAIASGKSLTVNLSSPTPTPTPADGPTSAPSPSLTSSPTAFKGEYFNNTSFSGTPIVVRDDPAINFNWGNSTPAAIIPRDRFSVRWTKMENFEGGNYEFTIRNDDGMRVYIDNNLIYDHWTQQSAKTKTINVPLGAGVHSIKVDYYENSGKAQAFVSFKKL